MKWRYSESAKNSVFWRVGFLSACCDKEFDGHNMLWQMFFRQCVWSNYLCAKSACWDRKISDI